MPYSEIGNMKALLLRFDAPLISFGGVIVDNYNITDRFPYLSMLAGFFGNALGYEHKDAERLETLQERLLYAARWDVEPNRIVDYHTVDLGKPKMRAPGWTTRGEPEWREGGDKARLGTHQRYRHYLANGVMTVAVMLKDDARPGIDDLAYAVRQPAHPLFIGRKTCLPAAPVFLDITRAHDVYEALINAPLVCRPGAERNNYVRACWPEGLGPDGIGDIVAVYESRDWKNQVHAGRSLRMEGVMEINKQ